MIQPGKTTLDRMQDAAHNEAIRIEIVEEGWLAAGELPAPRADRVRLRDDFAGIVRLIDVIKSDDVLRGRLEAALRRSVRPVVSRQTSEKADMELVPVCEESDDQ